MSLCVYACIFYCPQLLLYPGKAAQKFIFVALLQNKSCIDTTTIFIQLLERRLRPVAQSLSANDFVEISGKFSGFCEENRRISF